MKNILLLLSVAVILHSCSISKEDNGNGEVGEGGSLARFSIVGEHLYVVTENELMTYSLLANQITPVKVDEEYLGFGAETIFPYENKLLLGTESGMYIYDISNPGNPSKITHFQHIRSCDPVVAENGYSYVTLNTASQRCWNGSNELQIVNIQDPYSPNLVKTYPMNSPKGLDIHNDTLFVCDNGLKVLDVSEKTAPRELNYFSNVSPEDVIYTQGRLLLIGTDGFHQYSISSSGITKLSSLLVNP